MPWVSEPCSPARLTGPAALVAVWWWSRMEARSASANRAWTAACPRAQSTSLVSNSFARVTAWAILTRILVVPAAAASVSHSRAPSPIARNSTSAALRANGFRSTAPAGAGGKWLSSILGLPGVARRVPGHLDRPRSA